MLVYGKQVFLYILRKHPEIINEILLSKELDKKLFREISLLNKKIIKLDNKKAQSLAKGKNHQGFFLDIDDFKLTPLEVIKKSDFLLVLVGVTDVGNIGAIVRSAYALGVDGIIASEVSNLNFADIARSSSGSLFDMDFSILKNSLDLANELKQSGFKTIGSSADGDDVRDIVVDGKKALFLGSEGDGLSSKLIKKLDLKVRVHMERDFDSLNVNSAASILIDRIR